jgi:hypothetical protein
MGTKVFDAGGKLMLSGDSCSDVAARLTDYTSRGAKVITAPQMIGAQWVAACTLPRTALPDDTTTLKLTDDDRSITKGLRDEPEFDDGCKVDELGLKRIVTGPSRRAVELRVEHLKRFGAELLGEIEENGSIWTAVVDTGGTDKVYRW